MTVTADDFTRQMQALLPPGKAWARNQNALITKMIQGASPEMARVQGRGDDILREMNPGESVEMLPEHESLNGIVASGTTSQRQAALLAKLQDQGGHNPADYTAWAAARGFYGVVVRRRPILPFRAGDRATSRAHGIEWAHVHIVEYMPDILTPAANSFDAWTVSTGSVTANAANGPDGTLTADRLNPASLTAVVTTSAQPVFSVWVRAVTNNSPVVLINFGGASTSKTLTTRWTRMQLRATSASTSSVTLTAGGGQVYAWGAYAGVPSATFEADFLLRQQAHALPLFRVIGDYPKD